MKIRYITTALLAAGLVAGCIEVKVSSDAPKHHEGKDSDDGDEKKEDKDEKGETKETKAKHKEGKEAEDKDEEKEAKGEKKEAKDSEAALHAKAKISEAAARKIAMAKVPKGTIKEAELEMENGKLQWSLDMATPGSKDTTEVNVDAMTGEVLGVAKESAEDEAKEKDEEGKKEKKDKD